MKTFILANGAELQVLLFFSLLVLLLIVERYFPRATPVADSRLRGSVNNFVSIL